MKKILSLSFLVVFLFNACKSDSKKENNLSTEELLKEENAIKLTSISLESNAFEICKENECPSIDLNYLVAEGENADKINAQNQAYLVEIFNSTPDSSTSKNLEEAAENFIKEYFEFKNEFPESPAGYEAELSQEELVKNDSLLTYKTKFYLFTGGAHGYGAIRYLNFNVQNGKLLSISDLFSNEAAFTAYAEKQFRKKFNITTESINSNGFFFEDDTYSLPENIAITEEEVILIYNPYEAASYAQGQLELIFKKEDVQEYLNF